MDNTKQPISNLEKGTKPLTDLTLEEVDSEIPKGNPWIKYFIALIVAALVFGSYYLIEASKEKSIEGINQPIIISKPTVTIAPSSTCIPRPPCLDATPRCLIPESKNMCPKVSPTSKPVVCTMDAKQCSDGSYVSRHGPKCEFDACPNEQACGGNAAKPNLCPTGYKCLAASTSGALDVPGKCVKE